MIVTSWEPMQYEIIVVIIDVIKWSIKYTFTLLQTMDFYIHTYSGSILQQYVCEVFDKKPWPNHSKAVLKP